MEDLTIRSWEIETTDFADNSRDYRESIFSQGNGYMGIRGYRPDQKGRDKAHRSTFFSGFFEYIRPGITDMVNQPDFSRMDLYINGKLLEECRLLSCRQNLLMKDGSVRWELEIEDEKSQHTKIVIQRFLSMAQEHLAGVRVEITPMDYSGDAEIVTGIDGDVVNLPVSDNQLQKNVELLKLWGDISCTKWSDGGILQAKTAYSGRSTVSGYRILAPENTVRETIIGEKNVVTRIHAITETGKTFQVDKIVAVACYRDGEFPERTVQEYLQDAIEGYDKIKQASDKKWEDIWRLSDIELEWKEEGQGAVRYNIFQLIQTAPRNDEHASIGARGLMHGRYKGCYFWDTEIFLLPFFLHTDHKTAKNLLMYRYHTLNDTRESARRFSAKGARYSWMASDTGFEQCETWDTGCCEIHITADIAFTMGKYIEQSGDGEFFRDVAAEVFIETARYWTDRFTYSASEDRYHLLFVKGPDEYCGVTVDDFYTVKMAMHNLKLALQSVDHMEKQYPEAWGKLRGKLDYRNNEVELWQNITDKTVLDYDENKKLWKQDATFDLLEPLDIEAHKQDTVPLYHKINFDRLQRYQVLKQPAVLMYMALFPEEFSKDEVLAAWNYYEPKTLHDSTLSFGIHGMIAARLGLKKKALSYLEKSLFLDLKNVMKNTANEGIHTAALGATWQAIICGIAGVSSSTGELTCNSRLPEEISSMRFCIKYRDGLYEIMLNQNEEPKVKKLSAV